ncbi:MAG: hypothetical protein LIO79_01375 [Rikenellaceae bacterium]|nr:hypothetical protein [Rikenellaceae bacterium]
MNAIRYRLGKRFNYISHVLRLNHWRGHGIHSPFIYGMVREITYGRSKLKEKTLLSGSRVPKSEQALLLSIKNYLGYELVYYSGELKFTLKPRTLYAVIPGTEEEAVKKLYNTCITEVSDEYCIAILHAVRSKKTYFLNKELIRRKECVILDFHKSVFYLFNKNLNNKHYKIKRNILS